MPSQFTKNSRTYFVDDGAKRGPLTMFRVRFHPTEAKLLGQCADRRVAVWDLNAEAQEVKGKKDKVVVGQLHCPHETGWIRGFDVHPRGNVLATGGSDRTLRLWPWNEGQPAQESSRRVNAHEGWVEAVAFAPDGAILASAGAEGAVRIWDATELKQLHHFPAHQRFAADLVFAPDGRKLVSGGEDGRVLVWETESWQLVRTIEFGGANRQFGQTPRHSGVHRLAISRDSRWCAVAGGERLDVFDLESGESLASEKLSMDVAFHPATDLLVAGESDVRGWSYLAEKLASPEKDKNGKTMSAKGVPGESLATLKRGEWSLGLCFSAEGKQLALGKADGTVDLYDVT